MTPRGLVALRRAATLATSLPGVRLRLRVGRHVLVQVGGATGDAPISLSSCCFRRAVADAHRRAQLGETASIFGLSPDEDPAVDVGLTSGGCADPDGLYRVGALDVDVHAFATTLTPAACRAVMTDAASPVGSHPSFPAPIGLHRDVGTDITLVHAGVPRGSIVGRHPVLDDLLPRVAAEEIAALLERARP